jgi:hypothetical protein
MSATIKFLPNYTFDDLVENIYVPTSSGLGIAIYVVGIICLVLAFLILADIVVYRDTTVYRPASPLFCVLVVIGCIFGFTSALSWTDEPTFSLCQLRIWLAGIGFAIAYGGIVVKNFRIWRIFGNQSLKIFAVTNTDLIVKGIIPLLVLEIVILIIWTVVDPFVPVQSSTPLLEYYQRNKACASQYAWPVGIFLAYNGLLLGAGVLISFLTSKLLSSKLDNNGSNYNGEHNSTTSIPSTSSDSSDYWTLRYRFVESKFIGLAIYTTVLVGFCALAVILAVTYLVAISVGVIAFSVIIFFASILIFVFGPKVKRVHINHETYESNHNSTISTTKGKVSA